MKWYFERGAGQEGPVTEEEIKAMVRDSDALDQAESRVLADVFDASDLIVKVKEPQLEECEQLACGQTLFTYLHLAADREQARVEVAHVGQCGALRARQASGCGKPCRAGQRIRTR